MKNIEYIAYYPEMDELFTFTQKDGFSVVSSRNEEISLIIAIDIQTKPMRDLVEFIDILE